jgi:hypothetical protein
VALPVVALHALAVSDVGSLLTYPFDRSLSARRRALRALRVTDRRIGAVLRLRRRVCKPSASSRRTPKAPHGVARHSPGVHACGRL